MREKHGRSKQGHDEEEEVWCLEEVVEREHVWVVHSAEDVDLADDVLAVVLVAQHALVDDLARVDGSVGVALVDAAVHHRKRAAAHLALQMVQLATRPVQLPLRQPSSPSCQSPFCHLFSSCLLETMLSRSHSFLFVVCFVSLLLYNFSWKFWMFWLKAGDEDLDVCC